MLIVYKRSRNSKFLFYSLLRQYIEGLVIIVTKKFIGDQYSVFSRPK